MIREWLSCGKGHNVKVLDMVRRVQMPAPVAPWGPLEAGEAMHDHGPSPSHQTNHSGGFSIDHATISCSNRAHLLASITLVFAASESPHGLPWSSH